MNGFAAMILAGGGGRRLDGADKPALRLGGQPLLDRVLAATDDAEVRIVVGPPRALPDGVLATREHPPGGGPVAAVAAGSALVPGHLRHLALLAADLPFLTSQAVRDLAAAAATPTDVAVYVDADGRHQFLCAVWRTDALRERLAALGRPDGVPLKKLYAGAQVAELTSPAQPPPWYDCDTAEQLRRAETWLRESRT